MYECHVFTFADLKLLERYLVKLRSNPVSKRGPHSKIYLLRDFLNHLAVHEMFQASQSSSVYTNAGIQSHLRMKLAGE